MPCDEAETGKANKCESLYVRCPESSSTDCDKGDSGLRDEILLSGCLSVCRDNEGSERHTMRSIASEL